MGIAGRAEIVGYLVSVAQNITSDKPMSTANVSVFLHSTALYTSKNVANAVRILWLGACFDIIFILKFNFKVM